MAGISEFQGFRLSPRQQRVWSLQNRGGAQHFRAQCLLAIDGPLDAKACRAALRSVIQRHEILRTSFRSVKSMTIPLQSIAEEVGCPLEERDLQTFSPAEQQQRAARAWDEEIRSPFEFASETLLRAKLMKLSPERHWLLLSVPALCADRVGMWNLVSELGRAYGTTIRGDVLEGEPHQYADLAEWQNELLELDEFEPGRAFWRGLDYHGVNSSLPAESWGPASDDFEPVDYSTSLTGNIFRELNGLVDERGWTQESFLTACWHILLWRRANQPDLTTGAAHDGRKHPELKDALGLFQVFLPVRSRLQGETRFSDFVQGLKETLRGLAEKEEYFSWEQSGLDTQANGFFPYAFDYHPPPPRFAMDGLEVEVQRQTECVDRFKVLLTCEPHADRLDLIWRYDEHCWSARDVGFLANGFTALVESAVARPDGTLDGLQALGDLERECVLSEFNEMHRVSPPEPGLLHGLFEEQVARTPDAVALVRPDLQLTYRELDARANRVARFLRQRGVGPEIRVAVCVGRSWEMIVGLLAVLKSGGAYVPIDPLYPPERVRALLEDAQPRVLLTQEQWRGQLPDSEVETVYLDTEWDQFLGFRADKPSSGVAPQNLAYIIYTSGSTGQPKGVLVEHRNAVHSTTMRPEFYSRPVGNFLLAPSYAFDSSVVAIYWTLSQGGTLSIPDNDDLQDPDRLADSIVRYQVSHWLSVPALYDRLLDAPPSRLETLQTAIVAGETCPPGLVERHRQSAPRADLFNEYGPTEATVWSTVYDCGKANASRPLPIGRPIRNTQIYLLDSRLEPVPIGVPAELFIGGDGVARGYHKRVEPTVQYFVPNAFAFHAGGRLYRTGDLARWLPGGDIEFLGRVDNQVKIHGYRIEPGEIEVALSEHAEVREAVVLARETAAAPTATAIDPENLDGLLTALSSLGTDRAVVILGDIERLSADGNGGISQSEEFVAAPGSNKPVRKTHSSPDFQISLEVKNHDFIRPPRADQRHWLMKQALDEMAADLEHADVLARRFVHGLEMDPRQLGEWDIKRGFDRTQTEMGEQEIMEDWQVPLMKAMADIVTESRGAVLEIGFGRGVAATLIQQRQPQSHTIVECNKSVLETYALPWRDRFQDRDIRFLEGLWQGVTDRLGVYEGILFHAWPLNQEEFLRYIAEDVTFARHFFPFAAKHLKLGGVFTYLSHEIDTLSRRHQRALLEHFRSISLHVVDSLAVPEDTRDLWWADSMVVVKAIK